MAGDCPGNVSSPLLCGGGGHAVAPSGHVAESSKVCGNYAVDDDSDTSDDESDTGDRHPDPHPADPDLTGWSANQVGCYFYQKIQSLYGKVEEFPGR